VSTQNGTGVVFRVKRHNFRQSVVSKFVVVVVLQVG